MSGMFYIKFSNSKAVVLWYTAQDIPDQPLLFSVTNVLSCLIVNGSLYRVTQVPPSVIFVNFFNEAWMGKDYYNQLESYGLGQ